VWREIIYTTNNNQREGRRDDLAAYRRRRLNVGLLREWGCAFSAATHSLDSSLGARAALRLDTGAGACLD
jgi:hypothetical protein